MLCGVGCCVIGRGLGSELEVTQRVLVLGIGSTCGVRSNDKVFWSSRAGLLGIVQGVIDVCPPGLVCVR